jgi:hypothetical protein
VTRVSAMARSLGTGGSWCRSVFRWSGTWERHPGRRGDRRAGLAFGEAGADGGLDECGGQLRADAVLVGATGGPEEAGVALALVGGEHELDQPLAVLAGHRGRRGGVCGAGA